LRFQEALRGRGLLADVDNMRIDPWTVGDFGFEKEQGRRVINSFVRMRTFPLDNYYPRRVAARSDRPEHTGDRTANATSCCD
jgi:Cu2+-containing amine oxidase